MDNDQQITEAASHDLAKRSRDQFLNIPLDPDDRDRDSFDLEKEFAKSAKNKSLLIPISMATFFLLLLAGAWVASMFTDQSSKAATVTIGSFEDLKLKELFDTARKNQRELENIERQIQAAQNDTNDRIAALTQAAKSKIDLAQLADSGAEDQVASINKALAKSVAAEEQALQVRIKPLQVQAKAAQEKIDGYDNRIGTLNKKNQEQLDSQQRLFDIEKKKMTEYYEGRLATMAADNATTIAQMKKERADYVAALNAKHAEEIRRLILKFNPVIADGSVANTLQTYGAKEADYSWQVLPDFSGSRSLIAVQAHASFKKRATQVQDLLARLKAVPYVNSIPGALQSLDALNAESVGLLDLALAQLSDKERSVYGVADYLNGLREDGLILDGRSDKDVVILLKNDKAVTAEMTAQVRDGSNNTEVGTIGFAAVNGTWHATVLKLNNPFRGVKPFDRLTLNPLPVKK